MAQQGDLWFSDGERKRAHDAAVAWTVAQSIRLGIAPAEIVAAVSRGWTAQDIATLPAAQAGGLAMSPGQAHGAKVAAAPVRPIISEQFMRAQRRAA